MTSVANTQNTGNAWQTHANELAEWANRRLVNRSDAWGSYYTKDGECKQTTKKGQLTLADLDRHFCGVPDATVGFHSTADGSCSWGAIDIDNHEGGENKNFEAAKSWFEALRCREYNPILEDSNGNGGYHIWILFKEPIASERVYAWLQDLVSDYGARGISRPETFPKQATTPCDKYGNWLRIPGKHHKRDHWSKIWNGTRWLEGEEAVTALLAHEGVSGDRLPQVVTQQRVSSCTTSIKNAQWEPLQDWIQRCGVPVGCPKTEADGSKLWQFDVCPWNSKHTNGSAFIQEFSSGAVIAKCHHESCPESTCNWKSLQAIYGWRKCESTNSSCEQNVQTDAVWAPLDSHTRPAAPPWLVDKLFIADNCLIAADKKCLKTTLAMHVAAAISYGPNAKVLGRYDVVEQANVGFWSDETKGATLWDLWHRACASINRKVDECHLCVFDGAPSLDDESSIVKMLNAITANKLKLVILDPWGNVAGAKIAGEAANTQLTSQALRRLEKRVNEAGAWLWIIDHMGQRAATSKENGRKEKIKLSDVAYGGTMKWARQWMLIARNKEYEVGADHDLHVVFGGGDAHAAIMDIAVNEGGEECAGLRPLRISVTGKMSAAERERAKACEQHEIDQCIRNAISEARDSGASVHGIQDATGCTRGQITEHLRRCAGEYVKKDGGKNRGQRFISQSWCQLV